MTKILVSSLGHSEDAFKANRPSFVVSILDKNEPMPPIFESLPTERHIKLIESGSNLQDSDPQNETEHCKQLIDLAKNWDRQSPILIHCHRGVARSMAAAYILMCAAEEKCSEQEIAARLRKIAPHADPNLLMISEADKLLGRNDRMIEAIIDLSPCSGTIAAPIVTLPIGV